MTHIYDIYHLDCLDALSLYLPDNSVDAIVTDPPYGLSFMGKHWDYDVQGVDVWSECLRVLKPGGHLLAFAGTRTQHRMAVRIEDAGFEIRDMIAWVYGSGFPKSMDVSKAIDKARTEDAEPVRVICRVIRAAMDARGLKSRHLVQHFEGCHPRLIDHWAARDTDSQPSLPTWDQWQKLREVLDIDSEHDAEVWRLNVRKGQPGDTWLTAEVIGEHDGTTPGFGEHRFNVRDTKIREASETAAQWQGWGTALKPALEPITVARKPLAKGHTVAANVLAHGTGALNIDGCRIVTEGGTTRSGQAPYAASGWRTGHEIVELNAGRWPANLIHDGSDEVLAAFPQAKGQQGALTGAEPSSKTVNTFGDFAGRTPSEPRGDTGSAARFFYCSKASKKDRDEGLDGFDVIIHSSQSNGGGLWGQEERLARLLVVMDNSRLKVIDASGALNKSVTEWNTLLFGSESTGRCLQNTTFTTKTETNSTIESRILSCFQNLLTSGNTADANFAPEFGGNRVESVEHGTQQITITSARTGSALGAENAPLKTRLRISVGARRNNHVTVKPTDLMAYLCRLVTPPGGTVLDPFMGSGSTGKAAIREGFRFIGIEREAQYVEIARARIEAELAKRG